MAIIRALFGKYFLSLFILKVSQFAIVWTESYCILNGICID